MIDFCLLDFYLKFYLLSCVYTCVCGWWLCHGAYVEVRGQLCGAASFFSPLSGSGNGAQVTTLARPLPAAETSCCYFMPTFCIFSKRCQ